MARALGVMQRPTDALRVASSIFSEGLAHLHAGRLPEALSNFEMAAAINQKYLQPAALDSISCFQHIAAVHDKLGNLREAAQYLERAKAQLSALDVDVVDAAFKLANTLPNIISVYDRRNKDQTRVPFAAGAAC